MSDRPRCVIDGCSIPNRHATTCPDQETCPGCLVALARVGHLCVHHHHRLEQWLAEIPAVWDALDGQLVAPERQGGEKVHGSRVPGLSLNAAVVDARRRLHQHMSSWARMVVDERGVHPPADNAPSIARFLYRHLEWLCYHPTADEFYGYMIGEFYDAETGKTASGVITEARRQAWPNHRRRIPVSDCAQPLWCDVDTHDEHACGGKLLAPLTDGDALPDLRCDTCGRTLPPRQWIKRRELLLTVPEASRVYGVPWQTLYRWVQNGRITAASDKPLLVRAGDVETASMAQEAS